MPSLKVTPEQFLKMPIYVSEKLASTLGLDGSGKHPRRPGAQQLYEFTDGRGFGHRDNLRYETVCYLLGLLPEIETAIDDHKVDIAVRARQASRDVFMGEGWVGAVQGDIVSMATIIDDLGWEEELVSLTPSHGKGRPLGHLLHQSLEPQSRRHSF
jgi:hypothetical protein